MSQETKQIKWKCGAYGGVDFECLINEPENNVPDTGSHLDSNNGEYSSNTNEHSKHAVKIRPLSIDWDRFDKIVRDYLVSHAWISENDVEELFKILRAKFGYPDHTILARIFETQGKRRLSEQGHLELEGGKWRPA
ncbi:hypothetical protein JDV02_003476 [Purpureocillium takamizusanense]|uniref:Uncharacterized protein n=1 Tax=Purpureocillium takamizusanense TaxID=2060973 RepID=A0A9Q8QCG8_9HYPO|nr:uncharacterized protein JDV02_003476 [Purpureocillium takamizusanense]UNI17100.1 hypothetical protein JDV02_003476 [Purpureocillium takamizusanense]